MPPSKIDTKRREGFKEMIADTLDGKINLIVTKSVSRFARTTVDSLVIIRKLKLKKQRLDKRLQRVMFLHRSLSHGRTGKRHGLIIKVIWFLKGKWIHIKAI